MHLFALLSAAIAVASSALAVPAPGSPLADRIARRAGQGRRTLPPQWLPSPATPEVVNATETLFSKNWAGAVHVSPPAGAFFRGVSAQFVVPTPREPAGRTGQHAASAWVGIDGDTAATSILQTGLDFVVNNGKVTYHAWYEWFPAYAFDFTGIDIKAGNTIELSVVATSSTTGRAVIKNLSSGQTVTKSMSNSHALAGRNAEWIVEDYEHGGSLVPFANFGTVKFTNAHYTDSKGATGGPDGATMLYIEQAGRVYAAASKTATTVTVTYE